MSTFNVKIDTSPTFSSVVVECIYNAIGDGIKEDIALHKLRTHNSIPSRIWDLINTNICERLNTYDCTTTTPKRGPWEIVVIFEKETEYIYTIMREKRFRELKKSIPKRNRMHYIDLFAHHLNPDLLAPVGQTTMIPVRFDDEDKLMESIQRILAGFSEEAREIKRHALILFESSNYDLTSVRVAIVDTNLDIVAEQDWSKYIPVQESSITEKVIDPHNPSNTPSRGLKLTEKAAARKNADYKKRETERIS